VDVSTGVESAPGRKDPLLVRDFIANARQADADAAARDALEADTDAEPYDWREG
jgi:hypothetical protein